MRHGRPRRVLEEATRKSQLRIRLLAQLVPVARVQDDAAAWKGRDGGVKSARCSSTARATW
eukprot:1359966-Pleurochrysis_carterae.AAC.1